MLDFIATAGRGIRSLCCCVCFLLIGGPIVIAIGIVILATPNHRSERVSEYNAAIAAFRATDVDLWQGTISSVTASVTSATLTVHGSQEDIKPASSRFAIARLPFGATLATFDLATVTPFSRTIQPRVTRAEDVHCTSAECTSSCSSSSFSCSSSAMRAACIADHPNANYTSYGSSCTKGNACGSCTYTEYISFFYAVAQKRVTNGTGYEQSTTLMSPLYSFGSDAQVWLTNQPTSFDVRLYSEDDPLVTLERLTAGSRDFGITASDQRRIGIISLIIGCILTALVCLLIFIIYRCVTGSTTNDQSPQPQQQPPEPQPQLPPQAVIVENPMNPGFAHHHHIQIGYTHSFPPPGQVEFQPVYGQPQPSYYGQPLAEPGYGQPPPPSLPLGMWQQPQHSTALAAPNRDPASACAAS